MRSTTRVSECWIAALISPVAGAMLLALLFLLTSCAGPVRTVTRDVFIEVPVAVAAPCVDPAGRPAVPPSLRDRYTPEQWAALPIGSRIEAVRAQAGRRMNHADAFAASTAGCK